MNESLDGREAVEAVYSLWTQTGQCVFYSEDERLAVGDNMIASTAVIFQQTPGPVLTAAGLDVEADATYLLANRHMVWPYDDDGRLVGEDVWEIDPSKREMLRLDPGEVLTPQEAGQQLGPLIRPLPELVAAPH